ncbi:hypothetical protein GGF31_001109 [Allomyces arbusculus]|nr:hypothetical protein GGF31_001109 [Allomyces arbusculus]
MLTALHLVRRTVPQAAPKSLFRRSMGVAGRLIADVGLLSIGYAGHRYYVAQDPEFMATMARLNRPLTIYKKVVPIYLHYEWVNFKLRNASEEERDAAFEALHKQYAPTALDLILQLRGLYIKIGQVMTTRSDLVPQAYRDALAPLLDQVPSALPNDEVAEIVRKELGVTDLHDVFAEWDANPLGAASIAQVHSARLKDGREVVVKVQCPGTREIFEQDFKTSRQLAKLIQPEQLMVLDEMQRQFLTEFDFEREAWALETIRGNLVEGGYIAPDAKWGTGVGSHPSTGPLAHVKVRLAMPRTVPDLCTPRVIVMERLPGEKLVDAVMRYYREVAAAMGQDFDELAPVMGQAGRRPPTPVEGGAGDVFTKGETSPSPPMRLSPEALKKADEFMRPSWRMKLKMARAAVVIFLRNYVGWSAVWAWNHSIGWVFSRTALPYPRVLQPVGGPDMVRLLLDVHGYQMLVNGLFNGDPHPGNLLLYHDDDGTPVVGLIDYGQVKSLTNEQRRDLARLMTALASDDNARVAQIMTDLGVRSRYMYQDTLAAAGQILFNCDDLVTRNPDGSRVSMAEYRDKMLALRARDPWEDLPGWLVMPMRTSMLLRGLGTLLAPRDRVKAAVAWREHAERVLREFGEGEVEVEAVAEPVPV